MHPEFWLERWQRNEIGFHQDRPHPALEAHWARLGLNGGERVFVPLAGKSRDMAWLAQHGFSVLGVELSRVAVEAFFAEAHLTPETDSLTTNAPQPLLKYAGAGITLLCGNFFDLTVEQIGRFGAVFDRAALVALPPAMRRDYAEQMLRLSPPGTKTLLVTLEYDQERMPGPPHNVSESEVRALFGTRYRVELLARTNQLADFPKFAKAGVDHLSESVWLLA